MHRTLRHLIALGLAASLPLAAQAVDPTAVAKDRAEAVYDAKMAATEHRYDVSKEECKTLSGHAREVCMQDAKSVRTAEKADAKADLTAAKARAEAAGERNEAEYKAAKERCEGLSGKAEDACIGEAKLRHRQ